MKRVIGIGNALTDMLVNLKTDKVLDTFNLPKGSMSLVDAALQTEISKSVAGSALLALARRIGREYDPGDGPVGLRRGLYRQGGNRQDGRFLYSGS